jgi:hypothetical protein
MDFSTAEKSIFLFLNDRRFSRLRFFGGEPLMNKELVLMSLEVLKRERWSGVADMTTNGDFLDQDFMSAVSDFESFDLIFSYRPGVRPVSLGIAAGYARSRINFMLIAKGFSSASAMADLRFLIDKGFADFNILPTFYVNWDAHALAELKVFFAEASDLFFGSKSLKLRNLDVFLPEPLFARDFVVDVDGEVYLGNAFLDKNIYPLRHSFSIANINKCSSIKELSSGPFGVDYQRLITMSYGSDVMTSTVSVDRLLSAFCRGEYV